MSGLGGEARSHGALALHVVRAAPVLEVPAPAVVPWPEIIDDRHRLDVSAVKRFSMPQRDLSSGVNEYRTRNLRHFQRGARRALAAKALGIPTFFGALWATLNRDGQDPIDIGLVSLRVVTTAGVNAIVDAFQNTVELENFKFHGMGTGTGAEASSDTGLGTELTTQYNPDNTRATGTTTEGASANIYRTVGTNTIDSGTPAVTEHGVFSASSAGTLLDRSVFSAINLVSGDGITFTYDLTFTAGG